jgi:hypothetical protein
VNVCSTCGSAPVDAGGYLTFPCHAQEPAPEPASPTTAITRPGDSPRLSLLREHMVTAADLQTMTFPPPEAYIDGLVLEGLGILGGKPKLGKSFWGFRAGLAIATGGVAFSNTARQVSQAPVLYLALEDGRARLQDRIDKLLAPGETWPASMTLTTVWPRFDQDGRIARRRD